MMPDDDVTTPQPDAAATEPVPPPATPAGAVRETATVAAPRRGRFLWGFVTGCTTLFALLVFITVVSIAGTKHDEGSWLDSDRIGVLAVEGEIFDVRDAVEQLHNYRDDDDIKAIVVRINSPGGAIVPSQELFEEIRKVRKESGKPIVASLDSIAASGGYYVAVACDTIIANPGSLTGSIGVIAQWFNYEELLKWAKLRPETFTSGVMKDSGSPFRQLTEGERSYFNGIVTQLHSQFVRAVVAGRKGKMTEQQIRTIADGRVFTGEQALQLRLIDEIGDLHDAVAAAGKLAGMKGKPAIRYPRAYEPGLLNLLTDGKAASRILDTVAARWKAPFLYRWQ
jgi:protease-4